MTTVADVVKALEPGRGKAPVDGGAVAYLVAGHGLPLATAHPYATPKEGHGQLPGVATVTVWPRGFGESSPVRDHSDFGLWRLADDLDAVRRHLALDRWAFWGSSMGGFAALVYALKYQSTLVALILDSTAASYEYRSDPASVWPKVRNSPESQAYYSTPSWETMRKFFIRTSVEFSDENPPQQWEDFRKSCDLNPDALPEIQRRMRDFDTRAHLDELRLPCLILSGELDVSTPPSQARVLNEGIRGSILKEFIGVGHGGVLDLGAPGAVEAAADFLTVAYRSAAAASQ